MTFLRSILLPAFCCLALVLPAQTALKSPDEFLPHHLGEQFTPHHLLTAYFEYLATNAPATMRLERYGATNEARPLQVAFFSAPENLARLEQIRQNNLRLAGLGTTPAPAADAGAAPIAIVWLSMSVHGNEPSGSESSMLLAWQLATQTDPDIKNWLKNTVVIIDPSLNPDGYDRYTHWNRSVSNLRLTPHAEAREHREPWPGGRANHYYFDLNRDWAWATQVETQQRIAVYQRWLPQVHADLHEQSVDNPYYFAPAAEPMHDYITPWQRDFQTQIGQNHAAYFDRHGWLYFTKEVFDLFYPSYGDTYPMFNGAIGMTYEQGGNSSAGRAINMANGDTLTLYDRIQHHLTTSRSTIEMASKNARVLVDNFRSYYTRTAQHPQGAYQSFVIRAGNDPNKVNHLCQMLSLHHIQYGRAGATVSVKGYGYLQGADTSIEVQPNDLVISAFQPHSTLLQVLFEPENHLSDSLTYDITAWALPFSYGLDAYALKQRLDPQRPYEPFVAPEVKLAAPPYAWCIHRQSLAEAKFLSELLENGVKVRYGMKPFDLADQHFDAGALVITRADNHTLAEDLDSVVKAAAAHANVTLHAIFSGFAGKGRDLGSDSFVPITKPEVALVYGDDVDDNSFGHTWFFFERELGYPLTPISLERLGSGRIPLGDFTTLIFPNGQYNLPDNVLKTIQDWVRQGGRLIAFDGGVRAFADKDGFELKSKADAKKDSTANAPKPYQSRERESVSDQVPGAIVDTHVDGTHPLSFGLSGHYFSLKTTSNVFDMPSNAATAIWVDEKFRSQGFIGSRLRPKLENTPIAVDQKLGNGDVVYLVDNPLFRCFWEQGKVLFANALFF